MKIIWILLTLCLVPFQYAQENLKIERFQQFHQVDPARFARSQNGIIEDSKTGLQWLEGPDHPTSWIMAQEWVNSLGNEWRLPTTKELHAIYLKDSKRKGKYGDPLCLDEVFLRESGYSLWSVKRSSNSAWMYDFSRGYAHWTEIMVKGHFDRAIAVRKKSSRR